MACQQESTADWVVVSRIVDDMREGNLGASKHLPLKIPDGASGVFRLLRLHSDEDSLDGLLARVDLTGKTPAEVYHMILGRPPRPNELAELRQAPDLHQLFRGLLTSREFQAELIRLFLLAFPEKRRIFFVHIPKCAGTDLESHLAPRYLSIPHGLTAPAWTPTARFLATLSGLSTMVDFVPELFVYGHLPFNAYVRRIGIRPHDHVFTVLRDPIDLMISQANYNIGLLAKDPLHRRPDTQHVMRALGIEDLPDPIPQPLLRELAIRGLAEPRVARPNRICFQLGNGKADLTLENLISQNVEITDLARYRRWLKERWAIDATTQYNRSLPILRRDDIPEHIDFLRSQTDQDQLVFDTVTRALDQSESASLWGATLA